MPRASAPVGDGEWTLVTLAAAAQHKLTDDSVDLREPDQRPALIWVEQRRGYRATAIRRAGPDQQAERSLYARMGAAADPTGLAAWPAVEPISRSVQRVVSAYCNSHTPRPSRDAATSQPWPIGVAVVVPRRRTKTSLVGEITASTPTACTQNSRLSAVGRPAIVRLVPRSTSSSLGGLLEIRSCRPVGPVSGMPCNGRGDTLVIMALQ